ncbi:MAG: hypothetical protein ACOYBC_05360 [Bilifractor sp.]|jgi:hypothetical protein
MGIGEYISNLWNTFRANCLAPERILKSGPVTIVFWGDGTKTIVRPEAGTTPDDYAAFTAAVTKKVYGSNSRIKKIMEEYTEIQEPRK